jgi:hypothetical protein
MSKDVLVQYPRECLLEGKQTPIRVNDPPKKPTIKGKIEPLGFRRVGHDSEHLGVTWFEHLVMPFGMRKCRFQHVLLHLEEHGNHPIGNE